MAEICRLPQLAGGMPEKGQPYLILFNAAAVIGDADHGQAAVPNLHRNRMGTGIHGILQKLLYNAEGPLNDLSCRNLVDGFVIQQLNGHEVLLSLSNGLSDSLAGGVPV